MVQSPVDSTFAHRPPTGTSLHRAKGSESSLNGSYLDWIKSWDDKEVGVWLSDNRLPGYEALFRDNDIRGAVLLDVDQSALKEMGVKNVGDRIKITVAIKKLRSASLQHRPSSASSLANVTNGRRSPAPTAATTNAAADSEDSVISQARVGHRPGSSRAPHRVPPPLHLHASSSRNPAITAYQVANSSSSAPVVVTTPSSSASHRHGTHSSGSGGSLNLLSAPASSQASAGGLAPSPTSASSHHRRGSSPRQTGPPSAPAPKGSLPLPPSSTSSRSRSSGSSSAPHISTTAASPTASTVGQGLSRSYGSSSAGSGQQNLPTLSLSKVGQMAQSHRKTASSGGSSSSVGSIALSSSTSATSTNSSLSAPSSSRPATVNARTEYGHHQPLSHHPYATSTSPTSDAFSSLYLSASSSEPSSRPGTASTIRASTTGQGGANVTLSPITEVNSQSSTPVTPEPSKVAVASMNQIAAQQQTGFTVGRGGFARPTTPAGTVSVPKEPSSAPPYEDLMRKTVKFIGDDGVSKRVSLEGCREAREVLARVLKKFSKVPSHLQQSQTSGNLKGNEDEWIEALAGWAIFANSPDGKVKLLNDAELLNICFSPTRPERLRGLILRRVHVQPETAARSKKTAKLQKIFGDRDDWSSSGHGPVSPGNMLDVRAPATSLEPASLSTSSTASSSPDDMGVVGARPNLGSRGSKNRASMVSVMSSLPEWALENAPRSHVSALATLQQSHDRSPPIGQDNRHRSSLLAYGSRKMRNFLGHRPPSELISNHLTDFFPSADKKILNKTLRNSVRKSSLRPDSQFGGVIPNEDLQQSWNDLTANSRLSLASAKQHDRSRFSGSSIGSDYSPYLDNGPPLPAKDKYASVPLNERLPRRSISSYASSDDGDDAARQSLDAPSIQEPSSLDPRPAACTSLARSTSRISARPLSVMSSGRLSVRSKSSNRDSDTASLLTVDEITAEVENRRASMAISHIGNSPSVDGDRDDPKSYRKSALGVATHDLGIADDEAPDEAAEDSGSDYEDDEEDEEEDEEDSLVDVDIAKNPLAPAAAPKLPKARWIKGAIIGAGSFGTVYLGMNAADGILMAVKQVELPTGSAPNEERKKSMLAALEREIELLKTMQHENIVQYLDSSSDGTHLNIFLEYVPGGSVTALLRNYGAFEEELVRNFIRQILRGLNYLHERGIVHRDIKGANILVDNKGGIKISDFGISKKVEDNLLTSAKIHRPSLQGSVFWMAPEVVKQTSYTSKADIWSIGCLSIEMLTGEHPWATLTQMQAIFRIGSSAAPEIPSDISPECEDFLKRTFNQNHHERPSAAELLRSSFIRDKDMSLQTPTNATFTHSQG